ncbi:hypothetical protein D3C72_2507900 [compost metagenome]
MQVQPADWLSLQVQVIDQRGADQNQDVVAHEMTIAGNRGDCPVFGMKVPARLWERA